MNSGIRFAIIGLACAGIIICLVMIGKTTYDYKRAEAEYSALEEYVSPETSSQTEVNKEAGKEEEREFRNNPNRSDFPDMEVDYEGLKKKNRDYIGWLYVGSVGISYPVVQGADNEYYLHNTFEGQPNFAGCVFMDCMDKPDLTMYNTFLYGHAMKNGSMFGNLRKLRKDPSLAKNDPYIYLFMQDGIYRYQIYSYYIDKKDSSMYNSAQNAKEYRQYIRNALDYSMAECEAKPNEEETSITLVTCTGAGSQKQRFFVHGIFRDRYLFE